MTAESTPCDSCGHDAGPDPQHYTGTLHDRPCSHIHLCPRCASGLPQVRVAKGRVTASLAPMNETGMPPDDDDEYVLAFVRGRMRPYSVSGSFARSIGSALEAWVSVGKFQRRRK